MSRIWRLTVPYLASRQARCGEPTPGPALGDDRRTARLVAPEAMSDLVQGGAIGYGAADRGNFDLKELGERSRAVALDPPDAYSLRAQISTTRAVICSGFIDQNPSSL